VISSGRVDVFLPVVYHAARQAVRRYTLYAPSGGAKAKWREVLMDAVDGRRARMEVNRVSMLLPFVSPTSWVTCTTSSPRSSRVMQPCHMHSRKAHTLPVLTFLLSKAKYLWNTCQITAPTRISVARYLITQYRSRFPCIWAVSCK
jgi:hypothetical protein